MSLTRLLFQFYIVTMFYSEKKTTCLLFVSIAMTINKCIRHTKCENTIILFPISREP